MDPRLCGDDDLAYRGHANRCPKRVGMTRSLPKPQAHESNGLVRVPIPSITMLTVLPGFMEPTPTEVPQAMTSPASSVMSCEMRLTSRSGAKMTSVNG